MPAPDATFDAVLVGGGLQNALIGLALLARRPALRVAIVERGEQIGGVHTWCFHADDLPAEAKAFAEPLVEFRWDGYAVAFPGLRRVLHSSYAGFSADRLRQVVAERIGTRPGCAVWTGAEATEVGPHEVVLHDGRRLAGDLVVDARGPAETAMHAGYQKFVGHEVELARPHGLRQPVVMDATIEQRDGFRFFYVLPLAPDRLLVEDTRFSDHPRLDRAELGDEIARYCSGRGFAVARVVREEVGVLPMPWRGAGPQPDGPPLRAGYGGGWMHPATGYSFPIAARLAALVGRLGPTACFGPELRRLARRQAKQARYARLLNRLLFRWFEPERRRHVFERFYRLPEPRIRRFYALQTTAVDRVRLLVGRPPRGFSLRARLRSRETQHEPVRL